MNILHTADWHIGKKLHGHLLSEDQELFFDFLKAQILAHQIDVLLVSGDIFDQANPTAEARNQYYQMLKMLIQLNCKVIMTGGNHDSPHVLNAPREILKMLDIHIVGAMPEAIGDLIIPVKDKHGDAKVVIAAIPFIRDADLRHAVRDANIADGQEQVRQGISDIYAKAAQYCDEHFPQVPAIALGHLFAAGVESSESERDIQIGNLAAINSSHFGNYFKYIALGHIHKPQKVGGQDHILYSGSPIPLSFSERSDKKRLLKLQLEGKDLKVSSIDIPQFRKLKLIKGALTEITPALNALMNEKDGLKDLLEVRLVEEKYDPTIHIEFENLIQGFVDFAQKAKNPVAEIAKYSIEFKNRVAGTGEIFSMDERVADLHPKEVFSKLLDKNSQDDLHKSLLMEAFEEILQEIQLDSRG